MFITTATNIVCIVSGHTLCRAFTIEDILPGTTVDSLKEKIINKGYKLKHLRPTNLNLWIVEIPKEKDLRYNVILCDSINNKKLLTEGGISQHFDHWSLSNTVHIIVQIIKGDSSSQTIQDDSSSSNGSDYREQMQEYITSDGDTVHLPPELIELLNSSANEPAPRDDFAHLFDELQLGDKIDAPSLGEMPKEFGIHGVGPKLVVTEQMLELWCEIKNGVLGKELPCRRVLSGPTGIGKSYLAYFLAAMAYAESMLTLYIPDAKILDQPEAESAKALVARFFSLNKHILTSSELERLVVNYDGIKNVYIETAKSIFELLKQEERKTILVIDEHKMLFRTKPYIPQKYSFLNHLSDLCLWEDKFKGSNIILTGTSYANYETSVLSQTLQKSSVMLIGPFSEMVFSKLLERFPLLNQEEILSHVCKYTNRVPRELASMHRSLENMGVPVTNDLIEKWSRSRENSFSNIAWDFRGAMMRKINERGHKAADDATFIERTTPEINFMRALVDIGLGYRLKDEEQGKIMFYILSPSAEEGLLSFID